MSNNRNKCECGHFPDDNKLEECRCQCHFGLCSCGCIPRLSSYGMGIPDYIMGPEERRVYQQISRNLHMYNIKQMMSTATMGMNSNNRPPPEPEVQVHVESNFDRILTEIRDVKNILQKLIHESESNKRVFNDYISNMMAELLKPKNITNEKIIEDGLKAIIGEGKLRTEDKDFELLKKSFSEPATNSNSNSGIDRVKESLLLQAVATATKPLIANVSGLSGKVAKVSPKTSGHPISEDTKKKLSEKAKNRKRVGGKFVAGKKKK